MQTEQVVIKIAGPKEYSPNKIPIRNKSGIFIVNTTSRGRYRELSPFYLGPVKLYQDYTSRNMENAWQYSKVYPQHFNGKILNSYFEWAKAGWAKSRADRYPMGKGRKPLFSYWDGLQLGYIEARKTIYAPLYARLVQRTETFQEMKSYYVNGNSLILWDFDGYDYAKLGMTLIDVINDPSRKMGHAFVIAMLLQNERVWEE
jgi:hypothetical protein